MASMIIAPRLTEKSYYVLETIQNKIFKHDVKNHAAVSVPKPNSVYLQVREAWFAGKQQKFSCPVHIFLMLKDEKDYSPTTT